MIHNISNSVWEGGKAMGATGEKKVKRNPLLVSFDGESREGSRVCEDSVLIDGDMLRDIPVHVGKRRLKNTVGGVHRSHVRDYSGDAGSGRLLNPLMRSFGSSDNGSNRSIYRDDVSRNGDHIQKTDTKVEVNNGNSTTVIYNDTHIGRNSNINMRRDSTSSVVSSSHTYHHTRQDNIPTINQPIVYKKREDINDSNIDRMSHVSSVSSIDRQTMNNNQYVSINHIPPLTINHRHTPTSMIHTHQHDTSYNSISIYDNNSVDSRHTVRSGRQTVHSQREAISPVNEKFGYPRFIVPVRGESAKRKAEEGSERRSVATFDERSHSSMVYRDDDRCVYDRSNMSNSRHTINRYFGGEGRRTVDIHKKDRERIDSKEKYKEVWQGREHESNREKVKGESVVDMNESVASLNPFSIDFDDYFVQDRDKRRIGMGRKERESSKVGERREEERREGDDIDIGYMMKSIVVGCVQEVSSSVRRIVYCMYSRMNERRVSGKDRKGGRRIEGGEDDVRTHDVLHVCIIILVCIIIILLYRRI